MIVSSNIGSWPWWGVQSNFLGLKFVKQVSWRWIIVGFFVLFMEVGFQVKASAESIIRSGGGPLERTDFSSEVSGKSILLPIHSSDSAGSIAVGPSYAPGTT